MNISEIPAVPEPERAAISFSRKRRLLIWLNVSVMTLLMAAFLFGVNLIANTRFLRFDMTTDKVWEISPQSRQIVRSVKRNLDIYLNLVSEGPAGQDKSLGEGWKRTQQLLIELSSQNPKIRWQPIMEGSPALSEVIKQFSKPEPNTIYFVTKTVDDKPISRALNVRELYEGNPQTGEVTDFYGEPRIITTIAQLISDRKAIIYFTVGHREIAPQGPGELGMAAVMNRLTALENIELKPLDLVKEKAVPADADLVFIPAPWTDLNTVETDALREYWKRSGRYFVAIHPLIPDPLSEFRKFTESCGVRVNRDLVLDSAVELRDPSQHAVRAFPPQHPVNRGMTGQQWLRIGTTCSVDAAPINKGMQGIPLFLSGPRAWAEEKFGPGDAPYQQSVGERSGEIALAVASEEFRPPAKPSRMIVWGGVLALTNKYNMAGDMPNDLSLGYILNNFRWLLEREEVISNPAAARKPRMKPFAPPPEALSVIFGISVFGVPALGVILGTLAWFFRRK
ncbi:MAG TPA: Gldg family protein [Planctomycetota bacterium]